jgi:hypothetical protein
MGSTLSIHVAPLNGVEDMSEARAPLPYMPTPLNIMYILTAI